MSRNSFDEILFEKIKFKNCIKCDVKLTLNPHETGFINKSFIRSSKYVCKICNIKRINTKKKNWSWSHRLKLGGGGCDRKKITSGMLEELAKKQNYKDPFLGIFEIDFKNRKNPSYVSLDRINNSKGYTEDNIQLVPRWQNYARNSCTTQEFKKLLLHIKETFEKNK